MSIIMFSIQNKLKLKRELPNFVTNNVFLTSCTQSGCVITAQPSQLSVSIVVKLFNCFDAMGRKVNTQSLMCVPNIFNKYIFSVIFLHA